MRNAETQPTVNEAASRIMSLMDGPQPEESDAVLPEDEEKQSDAEMEAESEEEREDSTSEEESEPTDEAEPVASLRELSDNYNVEEDALLALTVDAKVNGKILNPTIKDLINNYQRGEEAGTKYRELAEERKQFESESENFKSKAQEEWGRIQTLGMELENLIVGDDVDEIMSLKKTDPEEYNLRMTERNMKMQQAEKAKSIIMQENAKRLMDTYTRTVQSERKKLMRELPEWQDDRVASKEQAELRQFLLDNGFQDWEIDGKIENNVITHPGIIDHRAITLARKAMMYDQSKTAAEPKKRKMSNLPKVGSGRKQSKDEVKQKQKEDIRGRVRKTGTMQDAALAIRQMMEK